MKKTIILTLVTFVMATSVILGWSFYFSEEQVQKRQEEQSEFIFIKDYGVTVTVGGIVGIESKKYSVGDVVKGQIVPDGLKVRIASHSERNEGEAGPWSYQEFIFIPMEYLKED